MRELTVGVFEHLEITSPMDADKRLFYMQRILRGDALQKHREVLLTCRQSAKELAGDEWTWGDMTGIAAEAFWTWSKTDTTGYDGHPYLSIDKCVNFERGLWFELWKCMWRKHRSVYQDHMNYVCNDIVKPFKLKILRYAERMHGMHDLAKYLPPPSMNIESAMSANWSVRNEESTISDLRLAIKDRLPKSMRDELDDHPEDYLSLTYECWCDLPSIFKIQDERKRAAVHIKKIDSARAESLSDSE